MKSSKYLTYMTALLAVSQLPAAAFADCTSAYQSDIMRIANKEYFGVYGKSNDPNQAWAISNAIVLVAPLAVTGILTTLDSIRISDREKMLHLLADAKSGAGLQLARVAEQVAVSIERVAEAVNGLDAKDAFCRGNALLSYGEAIELVRITLSQ